MPASQCIYYILMIVALFCSYIGGKREAALHILSLLLCLSVTAEFIVDILKRNGVSRRIVYHVYIPIEYIFLALFFFKQHIPDKLKKAILFSITMFILLSILISLFLVKPPYFP